MQLGMAVGGAALGAMFAPAGFAFMGMSGASLGWSAGSMLGGMLASDDVQLPAQFGPRLGDLKVQTSTYGAPIPRCFGTVRIAGNLIWASDIHETATTQTQTTGGKGGPPETSQDQTTYSYTADFAIAICEGPISGIGRIWANGKLLSDYNSSAPPRDRVSGGLARILAAAIDAAEAAGEFALYNAMVIYPGNDTQAADPTMVTALGASNTPAYRGTAYVVFTGLKLEQFGNRIPNLEFEVIVDGTDNIMQPEVFYPLPDNDEFVGNATYFEQDEVASRRNISGQIYAAVLPDLGSPTVARNSIGFYNNYDGTKISEKQETALVTLLSNHGLNGRIWYQVYDTAIKAISLSGQVWEFPNFGDVVDGVNRLEEIYEFSDRELLAQTQEDAPLIFAQYNSPSVGNRPIVWGSAVSMSLVELDTDRSLNYFFDAGDRIEGRLYIYATAFGGFASSKIGYVVTDFVTGTFVELRDYGSGSTVPHGMVGRDGFIYARASAAADDWNVIEKMTAEGVVVDSVILPDVSVNSQDLIRMVQDMTGLLYVQVDRELYRIYSGTMEIAAHTTLPSNDWIMPDDPYEGHGILVARGEAGGRENVYILADGIDATYPLLSEVVLTLSELGGLTSSDVNVDDLASDTVTGYMVPRRMSPRAMIEPLMGTYFFDAVESDNKVKYVKRGGSSAVTIPEDDLAAHVGNVGDELPEDLRLSRKQEMELPVEVNIAYMDKLFDYQPNSQSSRRLITSALQSATLQAPIVLTDNEAKQITDTHIFSAWVEREHYQFETGREYLKYEPTDVITVVKNGVSHGVRITQKDEGSNGVIRWMAVADYATIYSQTGLGAAAEQGVGTLVIVGPTIPSFLDMPLLRDVDDDAGFYVAARGAYPTGWKGTQFFQSTDGGVNYFALGNSTLLAASTVGSATTALGAYSENVVELIDEGNSVTVQLSSGTLESITREVMMAGTSNAAAIGTNGRWEIIQFRDATLVGTATYELTGLLRGRLGTEQYMDTHTAGDAFVLLNENLRTINQPVSSIGLSRLYKASSLGQQLEFTAEQSFTNTAVRKIPLSPVRLGAGQDSSGHWIMQWQRRTRYDAVWLDAADVPLGESTELYYVQIMDGATVMRTIEATTNTATYTTTQQIADFGSTKSSIEFRVAQVSGEVGVGYYSDTKTVNHPDPFADFVVLLMHMDGTEGGTTWIEERSHTVTPVSGTGPPTTTTAIKKFGTASGNFISANGGYLNIADSVDWEFGTGDFTIEFWINWKNTAGGDGAPISSVASTSTFTPFLFYRNTASSKMLMEVYMSSNGSSWDIANAKTIIAVPGVVADEWHHIAVTRFGTTFRTFIDGVQGSTWTSSTAMGTNGTGFFIGYNADSRIDEVRVTKGVSRYNAAFTPPSSPFDI